MKLSDTCRLSLPLNYQFFKFSTLTDEVFHSCGTWEQQIVRQAKPAVAFAYKKFICGLRGDQAEGNFLDLLERSGRRGVNFLLFSALLILHDQGVVAGRRISRPRWPTRNIICILKQSVRSDIMQRRGAAGIVSRTHECILYYSSSYILGQHHSLEMLA